MFLNLMLYVSGSSCTPCHAWLLPWPSTFPSSSRSTLCSGNQLLHLLQYITSYTYSWRGQPCVQVINYCTYYSILLLTLIVGEVNLVFRYSTPALITLLLTLTVCSLLNKCSGPCGKNSVFFWEP
jgi:hypothetical protein